MKKFISISLILVGVALIATVVVWYLLQGMFKEKSATSTDSAVTNFIKDRISGDSNSSDENINNETNTSDSSFDLNLTEEQRQAAQSIGVNPDTLAITEDMIDCASEKLSQKRIDEIFAGAAPTVLETLSLIPCLKN